jgi:hypothetical protein
MAYRSDLEALLARHVALEAEVAERTRARDEVARLLADARALAEAERQQADRAVGGPARRRRRRTLIAATVTAFALVAGAVGYRLAQPRRDRSAELITQMSLFSDEICGCSNVGCVQQVSDAMTKWAMAMAKEPPSQPKLDEATMKRATEIASRMSTCMTNAMSVATAPIAP